jgi:hypothetical protein
MEQMVQGSDLEPRPARSEQWRIVLEAPKDEEQPARFAVLRDERRVAWGLRDRDAAQRWLRRLSTPVQEPLFA